MSADTVAIASLVLTAIGAVAACIAAYFSWKAPTKKDLARVEQNTATTSGHLENVHTHLASMNKSLSSQEERAILNSKAQAVSISVSGENRNTEPLEITLAIKDPSIRLSSINLYNELGNLFGTAECVQTADLIYTSQIQPQVVLRWYRSGTGVNMQSVRGVLRVNMTIEGHELHRQFAVNVSHTVKPKSGVSLAYFSIEGSV